MLAVSFTILRDSDSSSIDVLPLVFFSCVGVVGGVVLCVVVVIVVLGIRRRRRNAGGNNSPSQPSLITGVSQYVSSPFPLVMLL